jgi:plasmid stability protein
MSNLTLNNLHPDLEKRLQIMASHHGRSIEEEAKAILEEILTAGDQVDNLADLARYWFGNDGVELEAPPSVFSQTEAELDCDYSRH